MNISLICFTARGFQTEKKIVSALSGAGHRVTPYVQGKYAACAASDSELAFCAVQEGGLSRWAGEQFLASDALVFVGACGIAVRAIAPWVKDKRTDPAVVVADEAGTYVIPILSGHLGGANELAVFIAGAIGGLPVITTATDIQGKFAVDVFAKEEGLCIDDMGAAKAVSADLLAGEPVGLFCDFPMGEELPAGLLKNTLCKHNIWITISKKDGPQEGEKRRLKLVPRCTAVGVGCKRGTNKEAIRSVLEEAMEASHIDMRSIFALASIDLKRGEAGICGLARELGVPFLAYSKEELESVPGTFTESAFVRKTTGTGNVCERAAMAACLGLAKEGRLLFSKYAKQGVTIAAASVLPAFFGKGKERP